MYQTPNQCLYIKNRLVILFDPVLVSYITRFLSLYLILNFYLEENIIFVYQLKQGCLTVFVALSYLIKTALQHHILCELLCYNTIQVQRYNCELYFQRIIIPAGSLTGKWRIDKFLFSLQTKWVIFTNSNNVPGNMRQSSELVVKLVF